uniref:Uncharacterized protein n=1 Tax=uncultured marine virus TaxID=186617 RepID=A0A0F7L8Y4_9VIRU|nr:hypothetical protein [uncultured marine virus]
MNREQHGCAERLAFLGPLHRPRERFLAPAHDVREHDHIRARTPLLEVLGELRTVPLNFALEATPGPIIDHVRQRRGRLAVAEPLL